MALVMAAAQAFISAGVSQATPKYGMTTPQMGVTQQGGGSQGMDLNALVQQGQQHESQLPKLQLRQPFA